MAKERSDQGTETQRPTPSRAGRGKQPSDSLPEIPDREIQDTGTSDDQGNPEWWRGDPEKRGEVL